MADWYQQLFGVPYPVGRPWVNLLTSYEAYVADVKEYGTTYQEWKSTAQALNYGMAIEGFPLSSDLSLYPPEVAADIQRGLAQGGYLDPNISWYAQQSQAAAQAARDLISTAAIPPPVIPPTPTSSDFTLKVNGTLAGATYWSATFLVTGTSLHYEAAQVPITEAVKFSPAIAGATGEIRVDVFNAANVRILSLSAVGVKPSGTISVDIGKGTIGSFKTTVTFGKPGGGGLASSSIGWLALAVVAGLAVFSRRK